MDYGVTLLLLVCGGVALVQGQSCSDPTVMQKCLKNLQMYEKSLNFFTDKEVLENECRLFNDSMKCLDDHLDKCSQGPQREEIDKRLLNVRNAVKNLCNNPQLKEDLLYNKDCYQLVSGDWTDCIKTFQASNKQNDICMVRDTVIKCGHESAVKHCSESASKSVCKMATNLMGMLVPANSCKSDGSDFCSSGVPIQSSHLLLLVAIAFGIKNLCKTI